MPARDVIIGIDGGGTSTRALCADLDGNVLGYAESGGTNPSHNRNGEENVRAAILQALNESGRGPGDVRSLVAGMAGLDRPEDEVWAEKYTAVDGLEAPRIHLNDAQVAHSGALRGAPGIVSICGTGHMTWAVTEAGRNIRDLDIGHYSRATARSLTLFTAHGILADQSGPEDASFEAELLAALGLTSPDGLRDFAALYSTEQFLPMKQLYGSFGPRVTEAAMAGIPLAKQVCARLIEDEVTGLAILAGYFAERPVNVCLIGGVGRSGYFLHELPRIAEVRYPGRLCFVAPDLTPLAGAAILALEKCGRSPEAVAPNLRLHPTCRPRDERVEEAT